MVSDYEIIPLEEVQKLKKEIQRLKAEKTSSPSSGIAGSLDRLANSLEKLFKIFEVAATEIEQDRLNEKTFEERIQPLVNKLRSIEQQNKDIADGVLALADIVKQKSPPQPTKQAQEVPSFERDGFNPAQQMPMGNSSQQNQGFSGLPPLNSPRDVRGESSDFSMPPPPPPSDKRGILNRFK